MSIGKVYALCLRLLNDASLAEKLTVETYLTTWQNIQHFREDTSFTSWLTGITTFTVLQWLRNNGSSWQSINNGKSKHSKSAQNKIETNPFDMSIFTLPDKERFVFVLHDIEKYSDAEVSDLLAIEGDEMKSTLLNAYKLLVPDDYNSDLNVYIETCITSLPLVIQPETDIWKSVFNELNKLQASASNQKAAVEEPVEEVKAEQKGKKFGFLKWGKK